MGEMDKSAGTLSKSYDKYLNSIEAHISRFKAAFQSLSKTAVNSNLVKGIVDSGTKLLNVLNGIISALNAIGGIVPILTASAGSLFVKTFPDIARSFSTILTGFKDIRAGLANGNNLFESIGVSAAASAAGIGTIIAAVTILASAISNAKQKAEEARQASIQAGQAFLSSISSSEQSVDQNIQRIYELKESIDKGTLSSQELYNAQSELLSIRGSLSETFGSEAESIDILALSADEAAAALRNLNQEYSKSLANDFLSRNASTINDAIAEVEKHRAWFDDPTGRVDQAERFLMAAANNKTLTREAQAVFDRVSKIIDSYESASIGYIDRAISSTNTSRDYYLKIDADAKDAESTILGLAQDFRDLREELLTEGVDINDYLFGTETPEQVFDSALKNVDAVLSKWGDIYDNAILAKIANNDSYADIVNQYKDAERNYKDAVNSVYNTAEDRSRAVEEALDRMDAAKLLFEDADFSSDSAVQEYISGLFSAFEDAAEKEKLKIQLGIDIEKSTDFRNDLNDVLALFADEGGKFTKEQILLAGQEVESMGDVTDAVTEQQFAFIALKAVADKYGMSVDDLIDSLVDLGLISSNATDGLDKQALGLITLSDELENATGRLEAYKKALEGGEKGDIASQYASAYKKFQEDMAAGRTGSNAVEAAINLILPKEKLADLGYDLAAAAEELSKPMYQAIFTDSENYGVNFANYIRNTFGDAVDGVYSIIENGNGTFDIAIDSFDKLAGLLDMDSDLFFALLDALDLYGTQAIMSAEATAELANKLGLIGADAPTENIDRVRTAIAGLAKEFNTTDPVKIRTLLQSLADAGYIDINPDTSGIEDFAKLVQDTLSEAEAEVEEPVTYTIDADISGVESGVAAAKSLIESVQGKTVHLNVVTSQSGGGGYASGHAARASGGPVPNGGKTLVNELGPEIISENGEAYIADEGKPTIVDLSPGAIVLDAETSKRAMRGGAFKGIPIRAAAMSLNADAGAIGGKQVSYWTCPFCGRSNPSTVSRCKTCGKDPRAYKPQTQAPLSATVPTGSGSGSSGSGGGSGSSSGSSSKEETWFEKQYAEHKHLVEMDKESQKDYLDWLDGAYKKAYNEGIIDLKEYRKYEEEVYKGRQDDFKDHINDTEHLIELEKSGDNDPTVIFNLYQQMMNDIQAELNKCYDQGLDSTNSYVQYLQNAWIKYNDTLKDLQDDAAKESKSQVKDLVDYRIKMLKQYLKNEIDDYKKRISYLKDFYDKQKEMLQDAYDEEEYLDEQSEKRKSIADIQAELQQLEFDDSAWAQKRKQKLLEDLADSEKDLAKFEKQHALEIAQDELDKAYDAQVKELEAKIEELEEKLNNPQYLYDTALKDVQNNSEALYLEMIEYNNKYGTGIKEDIVDMWEEAYKSLKRYYELYGEYYKGINLVNATGYVEQPGDNSVIIPKKGYASGTSHATPGLHPIDELGAEYIFQSKDGTRYRMFSGGEKVLNAKASNFLYKFAISGGKVIPDMLNNMKKPINFTPIDKTPGIAEIDMGDIIIQGNTDERTVSEIRRAQRDGVNTILKELKRLKK